MSSLIPLYATAVIITLVVLPPFLIIGWRSLRLEQPRAFVVFLAIAVLLEAGWSLMYDSLVWRWTWIQWPFFACLAVSAQAALLACLAIGIACRLNFGKGLKEYLAAARALADDDFEPEMFDRDEKGGDWDNEKGRRMKRARTLDLDFGARQPLPPISPSASMILAPPPQAFPARPARPPSEQMTMALPTLGKNAPWQNSEAELPEFEFTQIRL